MFGCVYRPTGRSLRDGSIAPKTKCERLMFLLRRIGVVGDGGRMPLRAAGVRLDHVRDFGAGCRQQGTRLPGRGAGPGPQLSSGAVDEHDNFPHAFLAKQDSILAIVFSREHQPAPQSSLI